MIFKPKTQNELHALPDEELIEYLVAARDAGDLAQMELAVSFMCFRYEGKVRAMALGKGITGHDLEEFVGEVFESAFKSAAKHSGSHVGEFVNWLKTITRYRIADFYKKSEKSKEDTSLDIDIDDGEFGPPEPRESPEVAGSPLKLLRDELLSELSKPHRAAVICRFAGLSSKESATKVNETPELDEQNMTPQNVDQIFSRFRKQLWKRYNKDGD